MSNVERQLVDVERRRRMATTWRSDVATDFELDSARTRVRARLAERSARAGLPLDRLPVGAMLAALVLLVVVAIGQRAYSEAGPDIKPAASSVGDMTKLTRARVWMAQGQFVRARALLLEVERSSTDPRLQKTVRVLLRECTSPIRAY
ncbi:MAG TPA: hypothetical protein VFB62_08195 [Polyangiaceae bacterium]|jgi:hypothetical protein|nr:hypothetical protein [Polyangiaceae bacterium]